MHRVLLRLAFDGAGFAGSQRNPGQRTVDGELLAALGKASLLAEEPRLRAAGRVDAGVSARDYPVAFDIVHESAEQVALALAGRTRAIVPWAGGFVDDDFDPRRAARSRTYAYHWPLVDEVPLDIDAVEAAWRAFEGRHDLTHFAKVTDGRNPERTILDASVEVQDDWLVFEVTGHAFLWNQVRRMVGAAIEVGIGRLEIDAIVRALKGEALPVHTKAPPHGLVLTRVDLPIVVPSLPDAIGLARARMAPARTALTQRVRLLDNLLSSL